MSNVALQLTRLELAAIASEANLFKVMGHNRLTEITVDYVPNRNRFIVPRLPGDGPLEAHAPHVEQLTFALEDQMFAGEVWTALTCRGVVVVNPFRWEGWPKLATWSIIVPKS